MRDDADLVHHIAHVGGNAFGLVGRVLATLQPDACDADLDKRRQGFATALFSAVHFLAEALHDLCAMKMAEQAQGRRAQGWHQEDFPGCVTIECSEVCIEDAMAPGTSGHEVALVWVPRPMLREYAYSAQVEHWGRCVVLTNLRSTDLNGQRGRVRGTQANAAGRWAVELDVSRRVVAVKDCNLERQSSPGDGVFKDQADAVHDGVAKSVLVPVCLCL